MLDVKYTQDLDDLIPEKLPAVLDTAQKLNKMRNLLQAMRRGGLIERTGPKAAPIWKLGPRAGFAAAHAPSQAQQSSLP